jgi:hypothetical protein
MFIKLEYLSVNRICGDDFKKSHKKKYININIYQIVDFTDPDIFRLPLSGEVVEKYFTIKTVNNDCYYISDNQFEIFKTNLNNNGII